MTQVSIVTITHHSRFPNLKLLYHMIQRQQYVQIKEWVIVEGSPNEALRDKNVMNITEFIHEKMEQTDIEMRFIVPESIVPLSNLRNIGNDHCKGDIIICMDDDDYYPPTRVPHTVNMLNQYNREIVGCSGMYMYDYLQDRLYKFRGFHSNHSTNNCFAYKKSYLKLHRYAEGLDHAEESSFTNDFREPMIQLHPEKCIVVSRHGKNTVDKIHCLHNKYIFEIVSKTVEDLIHKDILDQMKELYSHK